MVLETNHVSEMHLLETNLVSEMNLLEINLVSGHYYSKQSTSVGINTQSKLQEELFKTLRNERYLCKLNNTKSKLVFSANLVPFPDSIWTSQSSEYDLPSIFLLST